MTTGGICISLLYDLLTWISQLSENVCFYGFVMRFLVFITTALASSDFFQYFGKNDSEIKMAFLEDLSIMVWGFLVFSHSYILCNVCMKF